MNDSKEDSRAAKLAAKHAKDAQVAKEMNETLRQILKDVREGSSSSSSSNCKSLEARMQDAAERIKKIENWDWRVAAAATTAVQRELARDAYEAKQAVTSVGIQVTPAARSVGTQTEDESSSSSFLGWFFPCRK
tara:strand:+ start:239 stop:640 length:402 start_codon:yes stop_codon:yes gene_type:complete